MTQLKRAKSARKLDTCPLCSGRLTPIHARELLCDDCSSIFQPDVVERYIRTGLFELRNLVAILYCASGCSCCQDTETWNATAEKLGKLLDIPAYDDGSGYDFYTVRDAAIKGEQPKPRESISLPPELKGVDLLAESENARLREALEIISNMHDGNPSDAMGNMPVADYRAVILAEARHVARAALKETPHDR